jgi:hypothetical protein
MGDGGYRAISPHEKDAEKRRREGEKERRTAMAASDCWPGAGPDSFLTLTRSFFFAARFLAASLGMVYVT